MTNKVMSPNNYQYKQPNYNSYQNTYVSTNTFSFEDDVEDNASTAWPRRLLQYRTCHIVQFIFFICAAVCIGWVISSAFELNDEHERKSIVHGPAVVPNLIWSDEFDGDALDLRKWSFVNGDGCDVGLCGWGNNELEWYSPSNTRVENGKLVIEARQFNESGAATTYTSSKIVSRGKADFGLAGGMDSTMTRRFEARIQLPYGHGIWPAFWMLPTSHTYGGWPKSGEIDIMEYIGKEGTNTVHGTIHYGLDGPQHQYSESGITLQQSSGNLNETFHTYAVDRREGEIKWYIDDIEYSSMTKDEMYPYEWPFDEDFYFIINLAVGGNWPGNPVRFGNSTLAATMFPQWFTLDYVRVYQGLFPRIEGKTVVGCKEVGVAYEVVNLEDFETVRAVFKWSLPDGVKIISGDGTSHVRVNFHSSVPRNNINDSEIIRVRLVSKVPKVAHSIGLAKLQSGIGLRIKVIDYDGNCSDHGTKSLLSKYNFDCGRPNTCTEYVLHRTTDEFTCGDRIRWLMNQGFSELEACKEVGYRQFHGHCGLCNPV